MSGRRNRIHRDDALSRVSWQELEHLLAAHYRGQGYDVDHVGTGATAGRYDGGIDLKLRREGEYVVVQCKHWNAWQVAHNDVHQLLGIMVNEGATGAILASSGEFTRAAREAAARQGHVQLVDGDALRRMLGPQLESARVPVQPPVEPDYMLSQPAQTTPREPIVVRSSGSGRSAPGRRSPDSSLPSWALALFGLLAFVLLTRALLVRTAGSAGRAAHAAASVRAPPMLPAPQGPPPRLMEEAGEAFAPPLQDPAPSAAPTAEDLREAKRRADEAAKVLEDSTPEM